jgi:hypothetical protein
VTTDARLVPFGLGFVGLALVAISMFLPVWDEGSVTAFGGISENTLLQSGDGWITLIAAGFATVSLLRVFQAPRRVYWPALSGVAIAGYAVWLGSAEDQRTLCPLSATRVTDACQVAEPGIGVYVLGVGGLALGFAGVMFFRLPRRAKATTREHVDPMSLTHECPYCKSEIRPDATVCPHCRRESSPWTLHEGTWWRQDDDGTWVYLEPFQPDHGWVRYQPARPSEQSP